MSLRALAAKCKQEGAPVSDSQLSKIERGLYAPRPRLRAVLAEVLDMDVTELGS
jgi:transcriptional regulator with XRE-family HTH domain